MQDYTIDISNRGRAGLPGLPEAKELFTIVIDTLPSWNEIIEENNPYERSRITKRERIAGHEAGLALGKLLNIKSESVRVNGAKTIRTSYKVRLVSPITTRPIFCVLLIWRERSKKDALRASRKRDVYNAAIKGYIDGLTDAGLWLDDNEELHTDFWISYRGLANAPRMELHFYELGD